jgi:glycosyltransferase involved in cell wall biosynthesis
MSAKLATPRDPLAPVHAAETPMKSSGAPAGPRDVRYSVVIPVFNSANVVGTTVDATVEFFESRQLPYEIILVNDGSGDASWEVLSAKFEQHHRVIALNLLRNYGQHTAVLCGLRHSRGEYVVTLDDDMQNPPPEIAHLIAKADAGHDLVFGRYTRKMHSPVRRIGSRIVDLTNNRIFGKPRDLKLTNFRILDRRVVDRILSHRTNYPYINGLAILYAHRPADVEVEHRPRKTGRSQYGLFKITELVMRILFNYSSFPMRLVSTIGLVVAVGSLGLSALILVRALFRGTAAPGWASVAVMLSFFNGVSLLLLGMLGEYVLRILNQVSHIDQYHVAETLRRDEAAGRK